jgi:hypothetical protein
MESFSSSIGSRSRSKSKKNKRETKENMKGKDEKEILGKDDGKNKKMRSWNEEESKNNEKIK